MKKALKPHVGACAIHSSKTSYSNQCFFLQTYSQTPNNSHKRQGKLMACSQVTISKQEKKRIAQKVVLF